MTPRVTTIAVLIAALAAGAFAPVAAAGEAGAASIASAEPGAGPHGTADKAASAPVFHIQLWDAQKTGWGLLELERLREAGFTVLQDGWNGSLFPSRGILERVSGQGFLYGAYIDTRLLFDRFAAPAAKERARRASDARGGGRQGELNAFDPTYHEVVRRVTQARLADLKGAPGFFKIMINSEHAAPIVYDDLTRERAVEAGAMRQGQEMPRYARGVWERSAGSGPADVADPYLFLAWFTSEGGDNPVNRVAAEAARRARPGILAAADPLMDGFAYGQFRGMDILQDWVRVHNAPRDPLSIAYHVERMKAHVKWMRRRGHAPAGGTFPQIWIGPQLGTATRESTYAAPADLLEEALWLGVAFGARGATLWGYNAVRRGHPLDDETWGRIPKFRGALGGEHARLLAATDAPRKCAVLLSKANQVYSSRVYHEPEVSYENFYRALLTAHVPADVIYDEDALEGRLAEYKALFLPGIEHATPEIEAAIAAFEAGGGRVVRWPVLLPRYFDYEITKGNASESVVIDSTDAALPETLSLLPHQYRRWRQAQAAALYGTVADLMDVRVDNPDVIMNVVDAGGERFAVLVNDYRVYGAWTDERGYKWSEDRGMPARATVTTGSGENARTVEVRLEPAGAAIVPVGR